MFQPTNSYITASKACTGAYTKVVQTVAKSRLQMKFVLPELACMPRSKH